MNSFAKMKNLIFVLVFCFDFAIITSTLLVLFILWRYTMDFDPKKNYYELLGVDENASADEIKKVFRKAAVKHHPDR